MCSCVKYTRVSGNFSLMLSIYRDDTFEINACRSSQSVSESRVLKSTGKSVRFFVILHDKLKNRRGKMIGMVRA